MDQIDSKILRVIVAGVGVLVLAIGAGLWLYSTGKLEYIWLNPSAAIWIAFFLIVEVIAALVFILFALRRGYKVESGEDKSAALDSIQSVTLRYVVVGAGVLVFLTFIWAGSFVGFKSGDSEVSLPVVIIAGVVSLIIVLGLLTFVFSVLKLSDSKEALGLPSGSIRAVIALMLLVIFAIVAIFLYSDVSSNSRLQEVKGIENEKQENELRKQLDVVMVLPQKEATDKNLKYPATVYYRAGSKAGEDLAKQLIVLLGTLVTAVSSFYFGSSSIAAATKQVQTGGPNAKIPNPSNLNPDGTAQALTITGTNLSNVASVTLTCGGKPSISATAVVAGEASVSCKVTVPAGTEYGPWSVVVSDNANNDSTIPNGVTIGTKPQPATAAVTGVDVTSITPGPNPQPMTITGTNLGKVTGVKLLMTGKPDIPSDANGFDPGDKQVKCNFTVKPGMADAGEREVVLFEGANKVATAQTKVKIG